MSVDLLENVFQLSDGIDADYEKDVDRTTSEGKASAVHFLHFKFKLFSLGLEAIDISKLNISWVGDSNNVLNSLIAASIKFSFKSVEGTFFYCKILPFQKKSFLKNGQSFYNRR